MNNYRERLENAGLFPAFDSARKAKDKIALKNVLQQAGFNEMEIESLVWSNGDIPEPPTPEEKRRNLIDEIVGRIGMAIVTGCVLGGIFVYASLNIDGDAPAGGISDQLMHDYRTPKEAFLKPFLWGFGLGAVLGLVTGESALLSILSAAWKNKDR
jgi:hypothetical protein